MLKLITIIAFGFPLAACQTISATPTKEAAIDASSDPVAETLSPGEYRLAGADGAAVDLPHAITVSVSENEIRMVSGCINERWPRRTGEGPLTATLPAPSCRRALFPAEQAASAVFGNIEQVSRTPENGWLVEGGGHSVTLFSQ